MKNLILTLSILVYSVSLTAQDYAVVLNANPRDGSKIEKRNRLNNFTSDILSDKEFKYRDFLKQSKNSSVNLHLNGITLTEQQLTKLLRKNVRKAANYTEFQQLLKNTSSQFNSVLTEEEMHLLYERFQGFTIKSYMEDLAEKW